MPGDDDANASSQSLPSACAGSDVPEHSNIRASTPCCNVKVTCCNAPPPGSWPTAEHALGIRLATFQTLQHALAPMLQEKKIVRQASSVDVDSWPDRRPSGPLRSHGANDLPCGHQGITPKIVPLPCIVVQHAPPDGAFWSMPTRAASKNKIKKEPIYYLPRPDVQTCRPPNSIRPCNSPHVQESGHETQHGAVYRWRRRQNQTLRSLITYKVGRCRRQGEGLSLPLPVGHARATVPGSPDVKSLNGTIRLYFASVACEDTS